MTTSDVDRLTPIAAAHIGKMSNLVATRMRERAEMMFPSNAKHRLSDDALPPSVQEWLERYWGSKTIHMALWRMGGLR
jgi:hypothetical protein